MFDYDRNEHFDMYKQTMQFEVLEEEMRSTIGMLMIPIRLRKMSLVMWTRMSVGTLAEAEMDPDKYDKADANVSEADRRKIKNIDQPKALTVNG